MTGARVWVAVFVALLLLVGPATQGQRLSSVPLVTQIEGAQVPDGQGLDGDTIEELMWRFGVPGVSVAVIHDFAIHWAKGYGIADVEAGAAVDSRTLFQAASISKPVAAMATLAAVGQRHFQLDDDINTILTSWQVPANEFTHHQPVTPRGLLSHTSGTGDGFGFPGYVPGQSTPNLRQILDGQLPSNVGPVLIVRPPLTAFQYSGGGVTMMQRALMDALERPFPAPQGFLGHLIAREYSQEECRDGEARSGFGGRRARPWGTVFGPAQARDGAASAARGGSRVRVAGAGDHGGAGRAVA